MRPSFTNKKVGTMTQEAYVSLETAKLLNKKGFKGEWDKHYWGYEEGEEFLTEGSFDSWYDYPAPTQQVVMRWLREEHKIFINVDYSYICEQFSHAVIWEKFSHAVNNMHTDYIFTSYEEACEEGIKYCLENLI